MISSELLREGTRPGMNNMMQERALQNSGEMRSGSSFQKGQMVAADYTMSPSIAFSQKGTSGAGGGLGGFGFGAMPPQARWWAASTNEASTTLLMVDNRSGVQLAAAVGSAQNYDTTYWGLAGSGGRWGRRELGWILEHARGQDSHCLFYGLVQPNR